MPVKKRVKNIVRTISKLGYSDPESKFFFSHEVEDEISQFINKGWELKIVRVIKERAPYKEIQDAGVEMLYVLYLPD